MDLKLYLTVFLYQHRRFFLFDLIIIYVCVVLNNLWQFCLVGWESLSRCNIVLLRQQATLSRLGQLNDPFVARALLERLSPMSCVIQRFCVKSCVINT